MKTTRIEFTAAQARAVLHRLESWDCIVDVFADTDGLEHLAERAAERAPELAYQLQTCGYVDARRDELDQEILRESIEGSTWLAIHDPMSDTRNTTQTLAGATRALRNAWERIANAYGLDLEDVELPQC